MKTIKISAFLFPCLILFFISLNFSCQTKPEKKQVFEWTDLFNGKDLKGWKVLGGDANFEVTDDMIIGYAKANTPNTFLVTEKEFSDFLSINKTYIVNSGSSANLLMAYLLTIHKKLKNNTVEHLLMSLLIIGIY
jgi:hypothetical protein